MEGKTKGFKNSEYFQVVDRLVKNEKLSLFQTDIASKGGQKNQ